MRKYISRPVILFAAILLLATPSTAGAVAAPAPAKAEAEIVTVEPAAARCSVFDTRPGFQQIASYFSCTGCDRSGAAGVSRGDWLAYYCLPVLIGLDLFYDLYVQYD